MFPSPYFFLLILRYIFISCNCLSMSSWMSFRVLFISCDYCVLAFLKRFTHSLFKDLYNFYIVGFNVFSLCFRYVVIFRAYSSRIAGQKWRHIVLPVLVNFLCWYLGIRFCGDYRSNCSSLSLSLLCGFFPLFSVSSGFSECDDCVAYFTILLVFLAVCDRASLLVLESEI